MNKIKIKIPIYIGNLTIIQTNNFRKVQKKYNLRSVDNFEAFCFRKQSGEYFLVFRKKTTHEIISHECLHFVSYLFEDSNINFEIINDEPQCYLLGWVVGKCCKFLKI